MDCIPKRNRCSHCCLEPIGIASTKGKPFDGQQKTGPGKPTSAWTSEVRGRSSFDFLDVRSARPLSGYFGAADIVLNSRSVQAKTAVLAAISSAGP